MSNFSLINKGNIKNSTFVLDEKESHHVVSVLRLKKNDQLTLTDGQGTIYKAILNESPPLAKLCVPENNSPRNELGITFAIYYLLIMVMVILKEYE